MHRISHTVGKPIISADTGDKLGHISDALLDPSSIRVLGFVVGGGLLGEERVLPFESVQTLGGDTVIVRGAELIGAREWRTAGAQTTRSSAISGKSVVTTSGRRVGTVSDLIVDQATGAITELEIGASDLGGLRKRRSHVGVSRDVRIGPDAVVVPDSLAEAGPSVERDEEVRSPEDVPRS